MAKKRTTKKTTGGRTARRPRILPDKRRSGGREQESTAIAVKDKSGAVIAGQDEVSGAEMIGRLALFQGTLEEQTIYLDCDFEGGDFIDVLEKFNIGDTVRIVPVWAFFTWVKWVQGQRTPEYVLHKQSEVPNEDLEWADGQPPAATKCINTIVLIEGQPWPYVFIFKRTSYKVGQNIFTIEARRGKSDRGRGMYELSSSAAKGAGGQSYHQLAYRPVGNCPAGLAKLLDACVKDLTQFQAAARDSASQMYEEQEQGDGDDIPI